MNKLILNTSIVELGRRRFTSRIKIKE